MPSASYEQLGTYSVSSTSITTVTMSFSGSAYTNYVFIAYCQSNILNDSLFGYFNGNDGSGTWANLYTYARASSTPPNALRGDGSNYFYAGFDPVTGADTTPNAFSTYRIIGSNLGQGAMTLLSDGISAASPTSVPYYNWNRLTWASTGTKSSITFRNSDGFSIGSRFSIYGMA